MRSTARRTQAWLASVLGGGALALLQFTALAAPHPDDPPAPPAGVGAPAWAGMPLLGRAHRHADGHRCEVVHAPVALTPMAARPLPVLHQMQPERQKADRLRRER